MLPAQEAAEKAASIVARAMAAAAEWLHEGWIEARSGLQSLERARVHVSRDWYSPQWTVRFTIDEPPWFGDTIIVEVEEIAGGKLECVIPCPSEFHRTNIECCHRKGSIPHGHWCLSDLPKPRKSSSLTEYWGDEGEEEEIPPKSDELGGASFCSSGRARDLGWADSRHWMEEE